MAETNHLITRGDVAALVPEDVSQEVWEHAVRASVALTRFPQVRMSSTQQRIPVLAALPTAYWVDGDTGLKQTTAQAWKNKYIDVAELAVIVPIPEAVLDDAGFDIWGEVRPRLVEAMGQKVDEAIFFGYDKPAILPMSIRQGAIAAGNTHERGSATPGPHMDTADLADDFNELMMLVEEDGYDVTNFLANPRYKGRMRGLRTADGSFLYVPGAQSGMGETASVYGVTTDFGLRGKWGQDAELEGGEVEVFAGDNSALVVGIRQDINYKILTEATIHNADGTVAFNLAQQDMVALRATFRVGFQHRDVPTPEKPEFADSTRFPWAVMTAPDA